MIFAPITLIQVKFYFMNIMGKIKYTFATKVPHRTGICQNRMRNLRKNRHFKFIFSTGDILQK